MGRSRILTISSAVRYCLLPGSNWYFNFLNGFVSSLSSRSLYMSLTILEMNFMLIAIVFRLLPMSCERWCS